MSCRSFNNFAALYIHGYPEKIMQGLSAWDAPFDDDIDRVRIAIEAIPVIRQSWLERAGIFDSISSQNQKIMTCDKLIELIWDTYTKVADVDRNDKICSEDIYHITKWLGELGYLYIDLCPDVIAEILRLINEGLFYLTVQRMHEDINGEVEHDIPLIMADRVHQSHIVFSFAYPSPLPCRYEELERMTGLQMIFAHHNSRMEKAYEESNFLTCLQKANHLITIMEVIVRHPYATDREGYLLPVKIHYLQSGQKKKLSTTTVFMFHDIEQFLHKIVWVLKAVQKEINVPDEIKTRIKDVRLLLNRCKE